MSEEQPKEKKSDKKPIGSVDTVKSYSTFGGKRPEVQNSTIPDAPMSTSLDARKSKHPDWKQKTVYLPADLAKWLNIHAAQTELEVSEIVALALREYREKHP